MQLSAGGPSSRSVMSDFFSTPRSVAHQAPLSMGLSRQEYWSGLPFPPPRDLPNPGIKTASLMSPFLAGRFFTTITTWEAPPPPHIGRWILYHWAIWEAQNVKGMVDLTYVIQEVSSFLHQLCNDHCSQHLTSSHCWWASIICSYQSIRQPSTVIPPAHRQGDWGFCILLDYLDSSDLWFLSLLIFPVPSCPRSFCTRCCFWLSHSSPNPRQIIAQFRTYLSL